MQRGASASPTVLVLTSNVALTAPLPALSGAAKLTVKGACAPSRCIISGGGAFPIFTSPSSGPTGGVLTLVNLNFQRAAGGVLFNVRAAVNASQCVFLSNTAPGIGGGVLSDSFPGTATPPYRLFSRFTFQGNTAPILGGGAISINAGSPLGRVPPLYFVRCLFKDNTAPRSLGGAISVAGNGRVRFKTCVFDGNNAERCISLRPFPSLSLSIPFHPSPSLSIRLRLSPYLPIPLHSFPPPSHNPIPTLLILPIQVHLGEPSSHTVHPLPSRESPSRPTGPSAPPLPAHFPRASAVLSTPSQGSSPSHLSAFVVLFGQLGQRCQRRLAVPAEGAGQPKVYGRGDVLQRE
ncbi:unnamed protein product [Closterium sp. Naga37s-1]|nr:unnamed protein product [Closterium sp. Naga37s-1]